MSLRALRRALAGRFAAAGIPFAQEDALELVLGLSGLDRADLVAGAPVPEGLEARLDAAAERRLKGEPVDRILGHRDFYGRRFAIDGVLSPRGDTEVLLLAALEAMRKVTAPRLLELGTGSGALAVSLLAERPDARVTATDISEAALRTAARNATAHGVEDRLALVRSDWFENVEGVFDAVLSNPPYIDDTAMADLPPEVARFDPDRALRGGPDGLDAYRAIVPGARALLAPGGWLGVEIGFDQGERVAGLFRDAHFRDVRVRTDPAGLARIVEGRL